MTVELPIEAFRVQIVSDIHLELGRDRVDLIPCAEVLALCGDIGAPAEDSYKRLLAWASANYKWVFVIAGNHEFYNSSRAMCEIKEQISAVAVALPNVTFLNNESTVVKYNNGKVRIFGSTLWSDVTMNSHLVGYYMNDYSRIRKKVYPLGGTDYIRTKVKPADTTGLFHAAVFALKKSIQESTSDETPLVVLTHHLPSYSLIHEDFTRGELSDLNCAYASDLDNLIRDPVVLWAHGHSHRCNDTRINGVRVVSNPMGYPGEDTKKYKPAACVDVSAEIKLGQTRKHAAELSSAGFDSL